MRQFPALFLHGILAVQLGVAAASEVPEGRGQSPLGVIDRALTEAEAALEANESEITESRYRDALLEGWLLLGAIEAGDGRLHEARDAYEQASLSAVETRRALQGLALAELRLGRPAEAVSILRGLGTQGPADGSIRRLLARALVATGDIEGAVQELEELLAARPDDMEGAYTLATLHLREARPSDAESLFARLAEDRPSAETYVLIGRTYRDHGEYERARRALRTALEIGPTVERAHFYLGTVDLLDTGRVGIEDSIEHFRRELRITPEAPRVNFYLGLALVESQRHEEAIGPLEIALRFDASDRDALQLLGRSYLALDRPEEASEALGRALELAEAPSTEVPVVEVTEAGDTGISALHYQLAQALRLSGRAAEATAHFAAAKESSARLNRTSRDQLTRYLSGDSAERSAEASILAADAPGLTALDAARRSELKDAIVQALARSYANLGVLKMQARQFSRSAELFRHAAELDPDFPQVQASLGVAYFNDESFAAAIEPLRSALQRTPGDAELSRLLALSWLRTEHYDEAAALLEKDDERRTNPSLQYAFGLALIRGGRPAEAEAVFAELLEDNADWPELNVVLGQAFAQQGNYNAAAESLARALALDPDVAEAQGTLGEMFLRQGKLPEAEDALRAELAAHPLDTRTMYTLATVLDLRGEPQQALDLLKSLLSAQPRHASARYLSGKILLAQGAHEEALEQLSAAAGLSPQDPNVRYQLGQALLRLGHEEESQREFDTFRALKAAANTGDGS